MRSPPFLCRFLHSVLLLFLLAQAYNTYKHGDPLAKDTTMGPQADAIQGKAVLAFIEEGKKSGKLEMGGERVGDKVCSGRHD